MGISRALRWWDKLGAKTAYWDSISRPFWKRQNYRRRVLPGLRVGGRFHYVGAAQGTLWGLLVELFCILIVLVVTQLHEFVKTHRTVHQKVNFTVYEFKMKNFKDNTQNSSFPNYCTVDHSLCSWDYSRLLYLLTQVVQTLLTAPCASLPTGTFQPLWWLDFCYLMWWECLHHGNWEMLQIKAWCIVLLIV